MLQDGPLTGAPLGLPNPVAGPSSPGATVLVYTPDNPGPLEANEYTDWAALVATLATLGAGTKFVQIDDTHTPGVFGGIGAVVPDSSGEPSGKWDMRDAVIIGDFAGGQLTFLQFAEGAQLFNLQGFRYAILVQPTGSTPVVELGGGPLGQRGLVFGPGALLTTGGVAPFVSVVSAQPSPLPASLIFDTLAGITDFGGPYTPLIEVGDGLALELIYSTVLNFLAPSVTDWLASGVGSSVNFVLSSSANREIDFSALPSHLGASVVEYMDALEQPHTTEGAPGALLPRIGFVDVSVAAAALESPALAAGPLWIRNSSGGPLTVTPVAGTINGGASLIIADGVVELVKSDGAAAWLTF